jgi:DNA-binding YbaB/EbfC family protein
VNINPFDILKNVQNIQEQMGSIQNKLGAITETGSAGGGMVEIELSGKMEVLAVRIKDAAMDPNDVQMLQDLVAAALTQALDKIKERINREVGSLAGDLGIANIPGLFGGAS